MKSRTKAVVIGGGIAGCSTLYHLTQEGWSDVVLVERDELTSGTTWHSAAQVTNFGMNQTMVGLKSHSIELYKKLRDDPDYPVIVDAGVGTASDITIAMELGVDGVLLNTGIAHAQDPIGMARAMKAATEAGRLAWSSGRIPKKLYATASSPETDLIASAKPK